MLYCLVTLNNLLSVIFWIANLYLEQIITVQTCDESITNIPITHDYAYESKKLLLSSQTRELTVQQLHNPIKLLFI